VAVVQSHWHGTPEENLDTMLRLLDGITEPVELICLPEFFLGAPWYFPGRAHLREQLEQTIPGPATDALARVATEKGCYVLCGTLVERDGDRSYNTSALLDDSGKVVAKARKIHRFSAEMLSIRAGEGQVLVDTPFGKLGICVCSDFWVVEMPRMLALQGAEIIAVPGAALVRNLGITRPCIQANSCFNVCYTVFAGGVGAVTGERAGRTVSIAVGGCSTVAGPEGILAGLDGEEAVLRVELDMNDLRTQRTVDLSFQRSLYWCLHGRLPHLYEGLTRHYVGHSDLETLLRDYLR
jgi:predicted amidohydrolase